MQKLQVGPLTAAIAHGLVYFVDNLQIDSRRDL
jgi:hypothetical protein